MLSLISAYKTYGENMAYITQAEALWDVIESTSLMIAADAGTTPNKGGIQRNPFVEGCDVDGAVYWARSVDSYLNAISTGLFAQTGALLYEITKNEKYLDGSKKAMGWLSRMMLDTQTGILNIDSITPGTCGKKYIECIECTSRCYDYGLKKSCFCEW
jgi:hypothetical protein